MSSEGICEKCRKGRILDGKCTNCGFRVYGKRGTNALPEGQLLNHGQYRIVRVLGEGGYGITYEAVDLFRRKSIAIKEFFPAYALRRSANGTDAVCIAPNLEAGLNHTRIRFHEEAALLFSLKRVKEIVEVYHSFSDNNTAYFTMELLQGQDMQKWLKRNGCMSWKKLSPIVIQILRALYATHQMGYIHRDVTPDNIFLLENGTARLIDFGNARCYQANKQLTAVVKDKFSPYEQYSTTGRQGPWTDIYSLCVTIYYVLTGILPQKATQRSCETDRVPALQTLADVPPEVSKAVQIGMSCDERRRYQNVPDFAYALYAGKEILGGLHGKNASQQLIYPVNYELRRIQPHPSKQSVPPSAQERVRESVISSLPPAPMLLCKQGIMKGSRWQLSVGKVQTIGRGQGKTIQYPYETAAVSRNQCSVVLQMNGSVYVRDDGSRYGTAINGRSIAPGIWQKVKSGDSIAFGREIYILYHC